MAHDTLLLVLVRCLPGIVRLFPYRFSFPCLLSSDGLGRAAKPGGVRDLTASRFLNPRPDKLFEPLNVQRGHRMRA